MAENIDSGHGFDSIRNTFAAGKEKVILSYPRWNETSHVWYPTNRSYFLGKLETMADFKKLPVSRTEKTAKKANNSAWGGGGGPSSDEEDD